MCLRRARQGLPPPGVHQAEEDLVIEGEPPGGLWEWEGMLGPRVPVEQTWAKGCEPQSQGNVDAGKDIVKQLASSEVAPSPACLASSGGDSGQITPELNCGSRGRQNHDEFWHNDDMVDCEEEEQGLHECLWDPDEAYNADQAINEVQRSTGEDMVAGATATAVPDNECELGQDLGQRRRVKSFAVPVAMIESTYKKQKPKSTGTRALPFRTGLLARMAARGGVRPPLQHVVRQRGWVEQLLEPLFGDLV